LRFWTDFEDLEEIFKIRPKPQKILAYIYPQPTSALLVDLFPENPKVLYEQLHYD
jgi:hypothetical protein